MFALALTLCTAASCTTYVIETDGEWVKPTQCHVAADKHYEALDKIWHFDYAGKTLFKNFGELEKYLSKFDVQEDVSTLDSYELECFDYVIQEEV